MAIVKHLELIIFKKLNFRNTLKNPMNSFGFLLFLSVGISIWSCTEEPLDAQRIIDNTIASHGGELYTHSTISFDFRDRSYRIHRDGGVYTYERIFQDSLGSFHDYLNNHYFVRELNERHFPLSSEDSVRLANGLNSVVYFSLLPYPLNDPAVIKTLEGQEEIKGTSYHKIKVTFQQEGGGQDFQDEYLYWIHPENFTMDYLAYNFQENGGGTRFRAASKRNSLNGIILQDYENFKGPEGTLAIDDLGKLYDQGLLEKVSDIELTNIKVSID
jgi:hypothetical protein